MIMLEAYLLYLNSPASLFFFFFFFFFCFKFPFRSLNAESGFWKFLCITYRVKDTTGEPPLICGQHSAVAFREDYTKHNMDKGHFK